MHTIVLTSPSGSAAEVVVLRETEKAVLVAGNASEAWFPKAAIDANGRIAAWFKFDLVHQFLFHAPYAEQGDDDIDVIED